MVYTLRVKSPISPMNLIYPYILSPVAAPHSFEIANDVYENAVQDQNSK